MGEWISVEDRLPEEEERYLVYGIDGITVRGFSEYHKCWDTEDQDDYFCDAIGGRITHWMPLPPQP
jgi:hypothetical protein